jgi:GNAT superfamily N-acetyltransferase
LTEPAVGYRLYLPPEKAAERIRPATVEDLPAIARIHIEGWQTAYASFLPAHALAAMQPSQQEEYFRRWLFPEKDALLSFVAEVDGEVIGFCVAGRNEGEPQGYDGEIYKLFVSNAWQSQGWGHRLLNAALAAMQRQGFARVAIWSFHQSRAVHFYQSLNGKIVHHTTLPVEDMEAEVDVFGWELPDLLAALHPNS